MSTKYIPAKPPKTASAPMFDVSLAWANFWYDAFNVMLFVGAFAVAVGTYGSIKMGAVRERFSDERTTLLETQTALAKAELGTAQADIAKANLQIADARKQTASLEKDTADARKAIAEANARAAEANQKAETERVERLKLELRIAPRSLDGNSEGALSAQLANLAGMRIDFVVYESAGPDVAPLAAQIARSLTAAGAAVRVFTPFADGTLVKGILVRPSDDAPEDVKAAGIAIVKALVSVGLVASQWQAFPVGEPPSGAYNGPTGLAPDAKIRILIGAKP